MNYKEVIDYLYNNLPVFHRIGPAALKPGLDNILALCEKLGNPQYKFKSIHVTGTNGKGSSSHMIAAILQSAGYKVGLFTSPHLKNFTERSKVNGKEISEQEVVDFVLLNKKNFESIKPSFFEMATALAFDHFAREKVDIAVIEVGLGGRLDSTNIIIPEVSLITNISFDHQSILGNELVEIAYEKAGIIKKNIPVVISERQSEVEKVFINRAKELSAEIIFASDKYACYGNIKEGKQYLDVMENGLVKFSNLPCSLTGKYQWKNIIGVLATVDFLRAKKYKITEEAIIKGLSHTIQLTGLLGRWQMLADNPLTICDTAHNEAGIKEIISQIKSLKYAQLHFVFGTVNDKDIDKVLLLLPVDACYYFCQAKIPRALEASALAEKALKYGLKGEVIADVNMAVKQARQNAQENDLIFIGGSTFVVAEIDEL